MSDFPKTSWSMLLRAQQLDSEALNALCRAYRPAIYSYIRRHKPSNADADDSAQVFFANFLRRQDLAKFDPGYGSKFRSWLLGCVKHHLMNEHNARPPQACCDAVDLIGHHETAERLYNRKFAQTVADRVVERLRAEYAERKQEERFEALLDALMHATEKVPHAETAQVLGIKPNAVKQAVRNFGIYYQRAFRNEVALLVNANPDDKAVVDEIQALLLALEEPEDPRP